MNMSAACSALDALDRRMVQVTPLGIQGEGCRLGEKTHRVLDRRPGADSPRRQAALPASRRRYVTVLQGEGKYEAVYPYELVDGFEAERVIGTWMTFYSDVRPHSALGGRTPAEAYGEERAA